MKKYPSMIDLVWTKVASAMFVSLIMLLSTPSVAGPMGSIQIESQFGVNQFYYAFAVNNSVEQIAAAEIGANNVFYNTTLQLGGTADEFWSLNGVFLSAPMAIRLTSTNGEVLTAFDVITNFNDNTVFDFGSNYIGPNPPSVPEPMTWILLVAGLFVIYQIRLQQQARLVAQVSKPALVAETLQSAVLRG